MWLQAGGGGKAAGGAGRARRALWPQAGALPAPVGRGLTPGGPGVCEETEPLRPDERWGWSGLRPGEAPRPGLTLLGTS